MTAEGEIFSDNASTQVGLRDKQNREVETAVQKGARVSPQEISNFVSTPRLLLFDTMTQLEDGSWPPKQTEGLRVT